MNDENKLFFFGFLFCCYTEIVCSWEQIWISVFSLSLLDVRVSIDAFEAFRYGSRRDVYSWTTAAAVDFQYGFLNSRTVGAPQ